MLLAAAAAAVAVVCLAAAVSRQRRCEGCGGCAAPYKAKGSARLHGAKDKPHYQPTNQPTTTNSNQTPTTQWRT
jgi:hypothetical protein